MDKKKILLFIIIFLILLIPLGFYLYEPSRTYVRDIFSTLADKIYYLGADQDDSSSLCPSAVSDRTGNRKTGVANIENGDKSVTSVQMLHLGEKYIATYSDTPSPDIFTRDGKVLRINKTEQIITLDVGEKHTMKIKPLKIRMAKKLIKNGQKMDDSYIKDIGFCNIEKGDFVEFSVDEKDSKNYKSVVTSNIMTLIQ